MWNDLNREVEELVGDVNINYQDWIVIDRCGCWIIRTTTATYSERNYFGRNYFNRHSRKTVCSRLFPIWFIKKTQSDFFQSFMSIRLADGSVQNMKVLTTTLDVVVKHKTVSREHMYETIIFL